MAEGVSVDLGALTSFAASVGRSADTNVVSGTTQSAEMTALTGAMRVATGAPDEAPNVCLAANTSDFLEAQQFATQHDVMAQSAASLMVDALRGLVALAGGAETAAVRYAGTDEANAALLRHGEFDADHPYSSMALPLNGHAVITVTGVAEAFTPAGSSEAIIPAADSNAAPTGKTVVSPSKPVANDPFDADVTRAKAAIQAGQDPIMGTGDTDTAGTTIGTGKDAIVVPPDAARLPLRQPPLTTLNPN